MKLGLLTATCAGYALIACGGALLAADVDAYSAAQVACVENSSSKGEADTCRDQVKRQWCGPDGSLRAAGACSYEGGAP